MPRSLARISLIAAFLVALGVLSSNAQTTAVIVGSNLVDGGLNPVVSGNLCFRPADINGNPIGVRSTGQLATRPICVPVVGGVITPVSGTFSIVNTLTSYPSPFCWNVTLTDKQSGSSIYPTGAYSCVQMSNSWCSTISTVYTCNWDQYLPNSPAQAPVSAPTITVGAVTSLSAGASPTFTITGTSPNYVINVGIPAGLTGPAGATGATPTFTIGTVTTLAAGSSASVSLTGTAPNYILNISIPQGAAGSGSGSVTTSQQPGQALTNVGSGLINTAAFPTAANLRTGAITQSMPNFSCSSISDPGARQFCLYQLQVDFSSGLASLTPNPLAGTFTHWWNLSNTATIADAMGGSSVLTLGSGGYGPPAIFGGNGYPNEVRFGYVANTYASHSSYGTGTASQFNGYTDTNGNDASCYVASLSGLGCTVVIVGHHDPADFSSGGAQSGSTGADAAVSKAHGYKVSLTAPITVYGYDATSGFLSNTCPGLYADLASYTQPTTQVTTDFMVFLMMTSTGSLTCAINDSAASASTAVTLANDTSYPLSVGVTQPDYIQVVGFAPQVLNQAQRSALYNQRFYSQAPNFMTPAASQLDQYQIQCGDYRDMEFCQQYTNGTVGGGTGTYTATWSHAHVTIQTTAKRIYYTADPGVAGDLNFGVAVHVNGAIKCYDQMYATDRQNLFSCDTGNSANALQTIDIRIGGGRGNIGAVGLTGVSAGNDYAWSTLNSGYQGLFLNSIFYPKGSTFVPPQSVAAPSTIAAVVIDSIPSGNGALTNAAVEDWIGLEQFSPGGNSFGVADVAAIGSGSISLWNNCPTQAACTTWLTANLPPGTTVLIDQRGTNDELHGCALSPTPEGLSNYTLALGYLMTAFHALVPTGKLIELSTAQYTAYPPTAYDGCASSTNTVVAYNSAKSSQCSAFNTTWAGTGSCVFYDMTSPTNGCPQLSNTGDYASDSIHLTGQGAIKFVTCLQAYLGSSNPTSVAFPE